MDTKRIMSISMSVAVAVLVASAVLFPIIGDAMTENGTPITKTNVGTGHTFKEMVAGDILKCESVYSNGSRTDTWTLNGETVLNDGIVSLTWDWGLISDVYFMQVNAPGNSAVGSGQDIKSTPGQTGYYSGADSTNPNKTFTWEMTNDGLVYTLTIGSTVTTTWTATPTWAYVVSSVEDGAYMSAQVTTNAYYAKYNDKDIILAGNYTTGDLDTGYYYGKNGVLTVVNDSYTGTVNFEQSKSSGTTDIYDTLVTVSITDGTDTEEFSPYRALVPYEVSGHATSGPVYTIFSFMPILIILTIITGLAGMLFVKFRN